MLQVPIIVNPKDCVPKEDILGNVRENMKLINPKHWVDKARTTTDVGIVVSGGPSTDWKKLDDIMNEEYSKGNTPRIMCVKHSYPKLVDNGILPWACIVLDPRPITGTSTHGIVRKDLFKLESVACPSGGSCGGQFTANTMACVSEAIGLALPGSAGTPAVYETRDRFAVSSGEAVMNLLKKNIEAF